MQGKRVSGKEPHELEPGEYGFWPENEGLGFFARTPNGHLGNLGGHSVTEHEDGTITVSPSILVSATIGGVEMQLWHGWLERGVWREC